LLPQARQARRSAQFERFGLLALSNFEGLVETGLGVCLGCRVGTAHRSCLGHSSLLVGNAHPTFMLKVSSEE